MHGCNAFISIDLSKAEELSQKLAAGLPAHITSQSFPWQVLVQIVAINVFAMNHVHQHTEDRMNQNGLSASEEELTDEEEICFNLVFALTGTYRIIFISSHAPISVHQAFYWLSLHMEFIKQAFG